MKVAKISDYYSYSEGAFGFVYYPKVGMVKPSNKTSFMRSIEYLCSRGLTVDWVRTNIITNTLFVKTPEYMTEEERDHLLSHSLEELYDQDAHTKKVARDNIICNNYNRERDVIITEDYISRKVASMASQVNPRSRQYVVDWFNSFNIEDTRPDKPLVRKSTKNNKQIAEEGRKLLLTLFEQGKLIRYTKEEFKDKMRRYKDDQ